MKNVIYIASEAVPFIKTGGLADVVGSLPECFDRRYFDVRVMIPKYMCMRQEHKDMMKYLTHFYMDFDGNSEYVGVLEAEYKGTKFYFIDNEKFFCGEMNMKMINPNKKMKNWTKITSSSTPTYGKNLRK